MWLQILPNAPHSFFNQLVDPEGVEMVKSECKGFCVAVAWGLSGDLCSYSSVLFSPVCVPVT